MSLADDTHCISDLRLDEWLSHELDSGEHARLEAHSQACMRCRLRKELFEREHAAFLARTPSWQKHVQHIEARRAPAPRWRWLLSAAAAVGLVWLAPDAQQLTAPHSSRERSKGAPHVSFFVKRGERVSRGHPDEIVYPGDLLRFTYSSERPAYLALFNRDQRSAHVCFPAGEVAASVRAGYDTPLDFSVELDEALGPERFYALFCPTPFAVGSLRAALDASGVIKVPDDCQLDVVQLRKEPKP